MRKVLCMLAVIATAMLSLLSSPSAFASTPEPSWNPGANFKLIFDDEFNGSSVGSSWTPGWFGTGITGPVNSLEQACYSSSNLSESGGTLKLALANAQSTCGGNTQPYTGALANTNGKFSFAYGRVEFRAYLQAAPNGLVADWPALWLDGQQWPQDGETDIMEGLGGYAAYHYLSPTAGWFGGNAPGTYTGWHTFGIYWVPGTVQFFYDGKSVGQTHNGVVGSPMYLIIDNTLESNSPRAASYPVTMQVDWARVWAY